MKKRFVLSCTPLLFILLATSCDIPSQIDGMLTQLTAMNSELDAIQSDLSAQLSVTADFSVTQYSQSAPPWVFELQFPSAVTIAALRGADPKILISSSGPSYGSTIVTVVVVTNTEFFITGTRLSNVRYRTSVSNVQVDYLHPVLGTINPVYSNIPTLWDYTGGVAALRMMTGVANVFEVNLSTELGLWDHIDYDGDGVYFAADQNEAITVLASLFFEGYLADGTEFSGNFPMPLNIEARIVHQP